ncbi:MAG: Rne/Rng family ribonuclease [Pseudomonadota bacterium]|nr:Rne/Rng family ribonuclease [Pseudomonadota bacterium]
MERMLINAAQRDELRVAVCLCSGADLQHNKLYDLIVERPGFEQKIGNIYLARITSVEPSLDACFVEFGSDRHGFLPLKEISPEYFRHPLSSPDEKPNIREQLHVGQEIMIQVEKEERGNKGAALTTFISLAGSYIVLMPNNPRAGGISRRIEGDERDQLRELLNQLNLPPQMGLIVRTAALSRTFEELRWDLDVLLAHWANIEIAAKSRAAPFLIHREGNVVIRAIRDYVRQDTVEILIDDETEFQNAKHYLEQIRPDIAERVKHYTEPTPMFSRFNIEHQIETAHKRTIELPSGASIVIDTTEALVSIDINSARATKGSDIEETARNTNLEAATEIARQLRLRDIGGLIVIDFIDMNSPRNQRDVENHLQSALKSDRARVQTQRISRFGLLEMSRQRLRPSLREAHQNICPTCNGHGTVHSVESVALTLTRIIEEEALKPQTSEIIIQASTEAATFLLNEKRAILDSIEKAHQLKVTIIPNPNLQSANFLKKRIRTVDEDSLSKPSSERLQDTEVDFNVGAQQERRVADQPAVKQNLPTRPEKTSVANNIIKRLWSTVFGGNEESSATTKTASSDSSQESKRYQQRPSQGQRSQKTGERRDNRQRGGNRRGKPTERPPQKEQQETTTARPATPRPVSQDTRKRSGPRLAGRDKSSATSTDKKYPKTPGNYQEDQYAEYTQNPPTEKPVVPTSVSNETPLIIAQEKPYRQEEQTPIKIKTETPVIKAPELKAEEKIVPEQKPLIVRAAQPVEKPAPVQTDFLEAKEKDKAE